MRAKWNKRWTAQAFVCALGALCLALIATIGAAPVAQASGPGPCAAVTSGDLARTAIAPRGHVTASLSRTQGTVDTLLSVRGTGWPAGAPVVIETYMKYGDTLMPYGTLAQGVASSDGALAIGPFNAPLIGACNSLGGNQDGGVALFLVRTLDGLHRSPITFTYLTYALGPQISTAPSDSALTPGMGLTLTGVHWEPGEQVALTPMVAPGSFTLAPLPPLSAFQPVPGASVSAIADASGAFLAVLPALDEPPGTLIQVVAQGTGPHYGTVSMSSFAYQMLPKIFPSIHLNQIAVNPGGVLTVTGSHWPANVAGVIEYCRGEHPLPGVVGLRCPGGQHLGDYQTDSAGRFSATVHLPTNAAYGSVTVQARIPNAQFGLDVYATAQPLAIAPTYAQAHPRRAWLLAHAPILASGALAALAALVALLILIMRRRGGAQPAA